MENNKETDHSKQFMHTLMILVFMLTCMLVFIFVGCYAIAHNDLKTGVIMLICIFATHLAVERIHSETNSKDQGVLK